MKEIFTKLELEIQAGADRDKVKAMFEELIMDLFNRSVNENVRPKLGKIKSVPTPVIALLAIIVNCMALKDSSNLVVLHFIDPEGLYIYDSESDSTVEEFNLTEDSAADSAEDSAAEDWA